MIAMANGTPCPRRHPGPAAVMAIVFATLALAAGWPKDGGSKGL